MVEEVLELHGALLAALVLGLPLLEASTPLGVFVPGETALLLGGVAAWHGRASYPLMIALGSLGAIVGDSIGYALGAHFGPRLRDGRLGRRLGRRRWDRASRVVERRGFVAVVLGRFPPYLRTLVPAAAGIARLPYHRFVAGNVIGGVIWAATSVSLGYALGPAWREAARAQRLVGLIVVALIFMVAGGAWALRRRGREGRA